MSDGMRAETYELILHFQTIFTLIVQLYVFYLVQYKSPHSMKEYRLFLNLFTLYDALFTIALGVGLQPYTFPEKFASWCRGLASRISPQMELNVLGLTIFFGSNMIIAQDYCLTYRFTVIASNRNLHRYFMSYYYKIGWFIFSQAISIPLGYYMSKVCYTPEEFPIYFANQTADVKALNSDNKFIMWVNLDKSLTYIYMVVMLILFGISETICITLINLILSTLKKNVEIFSRQTYRLHIQLTILLAFQLMTPLILVLIPFSAALIAAFMGQFSATLTGQIGIIVIGMYGVTNALFSIVFVSPYRIYTYKKLIHPWLQHVVKLNPLIMRQLTSSVSTASSINDQPNVARRERNYQNEERRANSLR